jgi:AhpD family alkylhydroperoxidase
MSSSPKIMNESVKELVAIASAIAGNCEPCFRNHFDKARNLGVSMEDIREAVDLALAVKAMPHRKVVETAERYLAAQPEPAAEGSDCGCGSSRCC